MLNSTYSEKRWGLGPGQFKWQKGQGHVWRIGCWRATVGMTIRREEEAAGAPTTSLRMMILLSPVLIWSDVTPGPRKRWIQHGLHMRNSLALSLLNFWNVAEYQPRLSRFPLSGSRLLWNSDISEPWAPAEIILDNDIGYRSRGNIALALTKVALKG